MLEESKVITQLAEPVHITLTRNTKGFQFEISIHGSNVSETMDMIERAERLLTAKYPRNDV